MLANVVNVQIKDKNFSVFSHQRKMDTPTASTKIIYAEVKKLMDKLYRNGIYVRLLGVRVDNLIEEQNMQLSLFENVQNKKQERIDEVLDKIKEKYGYNSVKRAGEINIKHPNKKIKYD